MEAVLLSIKPKGCELIVNGKNTIEVQKTKPNLETPFKCYIYCTKEAMQSTMKYLHINNGYGKELGITSTWRNSNDIVVNEGTRNEFNAYTAHGKVIGEFVCDGIDMFPFNENEDIFGYEIAEDVLKETCINPNYLIEYGNGKTLYGWHISQLKIYDKPKKLSEFEKPYDYYYDKPIKDWCYNECNICDDKNCKYDRRIKRPPQSWCYVEELLTKKD